MPRRMPGAAQRVQKCCFLPTAGGEAIFRFIFGRDLCLAENTSQAASVESVPTGGQIMRAADCKNLWESPKGGFPQPLPRRMPGAAEKSYSSTMAMCTVSSWLLSTVVGAPIIRSWAFLFMGKVMTSRMLSSPVRSITIRSTPGAAPA